MKPFKETIDFMLKNKFTPLEIGWVVVTMAQTINNTSIKDDTHRKAELVFGIKNYFAGDVQELELLLNWFEETPTHEVQIKNIVS